MKGKDDRPTLGKAAAAPPAPATLKSSVSNAEKATTPPAPQSGDRQKRVAEAAYRRAETRNFEAGGELEDWLAAEREVDGK